MTDNLPLDDAGIGAAIRDAAAAWTMPVRGGSPAWQDRIERRRGGLRRWSVRLVGATAAAVVATAGLAFVAVWLNGMANRPATTANVPAVGASALLVR